MTLRRLLLGLMTSFLFGCGEPEIPEVSVEFLEYDEEMARFQLQADPEPTRDLAVLLNFNSDGETFHIWQAIPEESGTEEFAVELDKYVSWDVAILSLEGRNLNDYPVGDRELSSNAIYGEYLLGSPSRLQTIPVKIPEVSLEFLGSDKEGIWFRLQADPEPAGDLAVLLTFNSDGETFHIWKAIPKESGTIEFAVEFDKYVFWEVEILSLEGRDLNDYPVEDFGLSTEDRFIKYALGNPSRVRTIPLEVEVSLEFLGSDKEGIWFRLQADPAPRTALAVLLDFRATDGETSHFWAVVPKGADIEEFAVPLDKYVSWEVEILSLEGRNLNDYPVEGFGLSTEDRFIKYALGNPSRVRTIPDREGKMYWTAYSTGKIQRANLDGSNVQDLVTGLNNPEYIALDVAGGKMYWTQEDWGDDKIQRANLDGSNRQVLLTNNDGFHSPQGIALDVIEDKMYWATHGFHAIHCANLDGSNVQNLVPDEAAAYATGIALDVADGKMYWTDWDRWANGEKIYGKIQRANLDGSNVQDLVTRNEKLIRPSDIALDVAGGKMYWVTFASIECANLDGSNVQYLVTGLDNPQGIALDVIGGKMYWTASDEIWRANLDGSNVQDLITDLGSPNGIALEVD